MEAWEPFAEALGRRIKELRKSKLMSQSKLAKAAGLDEKYLAALERGERNVGLASIQKVMLGLEADPFELFAFSLKRRVPGDRVDKIVFENLLKSADLATRARAIDLVKHLVRASKAKRR